MSVVKGSFVKYIQAETSTRVQIKGIGSGFVDQEVGFSTSHTIYLSHCYYLQTGQEEPTPLYIHITYVFYLFLPVDIADLRSEGRTRLKLHAQKC